MTAAQHEAWLKETGQWDALVEKRRAAHEERARRWDEWRRAEAGLVQELRAAGLDVGSAWDLSPRSTPYPAALPILLRHLALDYPDAVSEGIARALATREARFAWDTIVARFRKETRRRTKDGLAVAIAAIADAELLPEVIELASDRALGESRLLLLRALTRSRDPRARSAIDALADDPDLTKEIAVILRARERRRTRPGTAR